MENGTFTFQRRSKALVWSKGLKKHGQLSSGAIGIEFGQSLHLHAFFVYASGDDETAQMCRLV